MNQTTVKPWKTAPVPVHTAYCNSKYFKFAKFTDCYTKNDFATQIFFFASHFCYATFSNENIFNTSFCVINEKIASQYSFWLFVFIQSGIVVSWSRTFTWDINYSKEGIIPLQLCSFKFLENTVLKGVRFSDVTRSETKCPRHLSSDHRFRVCPLVNLIRHCTLQVCICTPWGLF